MKSRANVPDHALVGLLVNSALAPTQRHAEPVSGADTATGEVLGKSAPRHTSEQFVAFLTDIAASRPAHQEIHVICDNVNSHKTERVAEFLAEHRHARVHDTPT